MTRLPPKAGVKLMFKTRVCVLPLAAAPSRRAARARRWVFTRSGGVWTQQGGKLTGTGAVGAVGAVGAAGDERSVRGGPSFLRGPAERCALRGAAQKAGAVAQAFLPVLFVPQRLNRIDAGSLHRRINPE